jgi:hypothetical protein
MPKLVIALAMFLVQAQPIAGAVLCQRHHPQPAAPCASATEHHQPGTDHGEHPADPGSADQCAITHACAPAAPVIRTDANVPGATPEYAIAGPPAVGDRAAGGLPSPPFHPPKS